MRQMTKEEFEAWFEEASRGLDSNLRSVVYLELMRQFTQGRFWVDDAGNYWVDVAVDRRPLQPGYVYKTAWRRRCNLARAERRQAALPRKLHESGAARTVLQDDPGDAIARAEERATNLKIAHACSDRLNQEDREFFDAWLQRTSPRKRFAEDRGLSEEQLKGRVRRIRKELWKCALDMGALELKKRQPKKSKASGNKTRPGGKESHA